MIRNKIFKITLFGVLFFASLFGISTFIINFFELKKYNVVTSIDFKYPTMLLFTIPYFFYYIAIFAGPFLIGYKDIDKLKKYTTALIISSTIGFIFFIIFPTYVDKSLFDINQDSIFGKIIGLKRKIDNNCNAMPSFHSLHSWLIFINIRKLEIDKKYKFISFIILFSICISTFLIREHGIIDSFTAIILAECINYLVYKHNLTLKIPILNI